MRFLYSFHSLIFPFSFNIYSHLTNYTECTRTKVKCRTVPTFLSCHSLSLQKKKKKLNIDKSKTLKTEDKLQYNTIQRQHNAICTKFVAFCHIKYVKMRNKKKTTKEAESLYCCWYVEHQICRQQKQWTHHVCLAFKSLVWTHFIYQLLPSKHFEPWKIRQRHTIAFLFIHYTHKSKNNKNRGEDKNNIKTINLT